VFIGGGTGTNNTVSVNLAGQSNAVDATSLGLSTTNVLNGGVGVSANTKRLDAPGATFLAGSATQAFTFYLATASGAHTITATLTGTAAGLSQSAALTQLNGDLSQYGITAGVDTNGLLQFSGSTAFNLSVASASTATAGLTTGAGTASNTSNYIVNGATAFTAESADEPLTIQADGKSISVTLTAANDTSLAAALSDINAQTAQYGVYAIANTAGTGVDFQSASSFSVYANGTAAGVFAAAGNNVATAPVTGTTNNATAAITAIDTAIQALGVVQGSVGAGENTLAYATSLAQSQITSFSSAESQIKDADVAQQAANLTKAQVLVQTSVAALAQANSEPQAILKLLQ
jgi:flagellin